MLCWLFQSKAVGSKDELSVCPLVFGCDAYKALCKGTGRCDEGGGFFSGILTKKMTTLIFINHSNWQLRKMI